MALFLSKRWVANGYFTGQFVYNSATFEAGGEVRPMCDSCRQFGKKLLIMLFHHCRFLARRDEFDDSS